MGALFLEQAANSEFIRFGHTQDTTASPRTRSLNCFSRSNTRTLAPRSAIALANADAAIPPPTVMMS